MLTGNTNKDDKLQVHGFLIGIEIEDGLDLERLMRKLGETLNWYPGVGTVDIEHLGKIEVIDDSGVTAIINDIPGFESEEDKERKEFIQAMSEMSTTKKES